jgi:SAM-dependent methyltransferase
MTDFRGRLSSDGTAFDRKADRKGRAMPDLFEIYRTQPARYDELVSREDCRGNLLPAIRALHGLNGAAVVEFGAGTGRLTRLLAPHVGSIHAFDASRPMLDVAGERLAREGYRNCRLEVGDHRSVPAPSGLADISIAGWTISAIAVTARPWEHEVQRALDEMRRVLKPRGALIVIETLGTGFEEPHPPEVLLAYYQFLDDNGFRKTWIRTDYLFQDLAEARALTEFFFGSGPLGALAPVKDGVLLPECTGLWWSARDSAG